MNSDWLSSENVEEKSTANCFTMEGSEERFVFFI